MKVKSRKELKSYFLTRIYTNIFEVVVSLISGAALRLIKETTTIFAEVSAVLFLNL